MSSTCCWSVGPCAELTIAVSHSICPINCLTKTLMAILLCPNNIGVSPGIMLIYLWHCFFDRYGLCDSEVRSENMWKWCCSSQHSHCAGQGLLWNEDSVLRYFPPQSATRRGRGGWRGKTFQSQLISVKLWILLFLSQSWATTCHEVASGFPSFD